MALIGCPECKKEVSDRAHSCPFCGFPLDEYFEEKEEEVQRAIEAEEEKKRLQRLEQRRCEYAEEKKLKVCGKEISFNVNEKICAIIGASFEISQENLHKTISELLFADKGPADMNAQQFNSYAHKLIAILDNTLVETSIELCDRFLAEDSEEREYFRKDLQIAADTRGLVKALRVAYEQAHDEYQLNIANAHSQYFNDYYAAGTPAQPIEEVWSSTLMGLAGATLSAKLINGVAAALTSGAVKQQEEKAWNKYTAELWKEALICNIKIFSVLDNYVDGVVAAYKQYLTEYLMNAGTLFEKHVYPTDSVDYDTFMEIMKNQEAFHKEKIEVFKKIVSINPADYLIYAVAMEYMSFDVAEVNDLLALYDFFEIKEAVQAQLIDDNHPAAALLEESFITDSKHVHACSFMARALGERGFATLEEKEAYITEKNEYENLLNELEAVENWFDASCVVDCYDKLQKLGVPKFDTWQERYERAIAIGTPIVKEIDSRFVKAVLPALQVLVPGEAIFKYQKETVWEARKNLLERYKDLRGVFAEDEMPIVKIAAWNNVLLVSTRAFYYLNNSNSALIVKFDIDDIRRIEASRPTVLSSGGFEVYLSEKQYRIFDSHFPEKQFSCLLKFANELISYVKSSPIIQKENVARLCKRTPRENLNDEYFQEQLVRIIKMIHIANQVDDKSVLVMKWTHQITQQENPFLYKLICESRMGIEFILLFDNYRIVTDSAIYISNRFLIHSDPRMTRYRFADAQEIISVRSRSGSGTGLLFSRGEGVEVVQTEEGTKYFHHAVNAVAFVLAESKVKERVYIDKEFVYCTNCNTFNFGKVKEIAVCSECKNNIRGWINASAYEYCQKKLMEIADKDIQLLVEEMQPYIEKIFGDILQEVEAEKVMREEAAARVAREKEVRKEKFTPVEIQAAEKFDEYYKQEGGDEKFRKKDFHKTHFEKMKFLYKYYKEISLELLPDASEIASSWKEFWINHNNNDNNSGLFSWYDSIEWIPLEVDILEFMRCVLMQKKLYWNMAVLSDFWIWGEPEDSDMFPNDIVRSVIEEDDTILMYHDSSANKQGENGLVLTKKYLIGLDGFKCLEIADIIDIRLYLDGYIRIETAKQEILYKNEQWDKTSNMFSHLEKLLRVICVRYGKNPYLWNVGMITPKPAILSYDKSQGIERNEFLKRFKTLLKVEPERMKSLLGVLINDYDYNIYNHLPQSSWFKTRKEQGEYVLYVARDIIITERNVYIYQDKFDIADVTEVLVGNKINSQNVKYKRGIKVITRSGDTKCFDFSDEYDDVIIYILNLCLASINEKNSSSMFFRNKGYFCIRCGALDIERKTGFLGIKFRCNECGNKDDKYICAYGNYFNMKAYEERISEIAPVFKR